MGKVFSGVTYVTMTCFFVLFFVLPIWGSMQSAFLDADGAFTLEYLAEIFRNPLYREGLINSASVAAATTAGCILVAVPLAVVYVRFSYPGRALLNSLMMTPLILPPFVGAVGVQAMLGQAGALNSLLIDLGVLSPSDPIDWLGDGRIAGVVLMNVLHLYPIVYLNSSAALANLDPALEEAAANLGSPPFRRFLRVTLPMVVPGIFAGASIAFIWAFTELGVPLIFDFDRVTSVQIFSAIKDLSNNPLPYALVVTLLMSTLFFYATSKIVVRGIDVTGGGRATLGRSPVDLTGLQAWSCSLLFLLVSALALMPHVGVVLLSVARDWYGSVIPEGLTLAHYRTALGHETTLTAVQNSLKYASLSTLLDLILGISAAYLIVRGQRAGRRVLDALTMLPLAVPGIVMAFGYLALSREGQVLHPLMLGEDPLLLLVVAYAMRRLPYVVRAAVAGFQQVSPTLEEAAQNLGAAPERALWQITLPLVVPNLIAGGLLAFSFAMLEVSDSMILAQQAAHYPITKAIYTLSSALGEGPALACALGVWSMLFLTVVILAAGAVLGKTLGALYRA